MARRPSLSLVRCARARHAAGVPTPRGRVDFIPAPVLAPLSSVQHGIAASGAFARSLADE